MIRLRVFRAIDERETCEKFVEGHVKILKVFGITMITSAKAEWMDDPLTYVIVAEDSEDQRVLGGARVQIAGGKLPLPLEDAVQRYDPNVHAEVEKNVANGTCELCGLWNSREIAGLGIGSFFLTRVAVCIAPQLSMKTMFALCAPYTVEMAEKVGFTVATFLGDKGEFLYPKEGLVATAVFLRDSATLSTADHNEREEIFSLRNNLKQTRTEMGRRKEFELMYDLEIQNKP
jgi:hypothetical protein